MLAPLLLGPLALGGCAAEVGSPGSAASWTTETDQALGSALSSLGTVRLILESQAHGRLPAPYVKVSLRDALEVLQKETSSYLATTPPPSKTSENAVAVTILQEAITVLNRAAVAGSDQDRRASAYEEVESEYHRVEQLQQKLVGR